MKKRHYLKSVIATVALVVGFMVQDSFAPPIGPGTSVGGGGGTPSCWPPPCIPIDGGIAFLALAGAAIAGRKLWA